MFDRYNSSLRIENVIMTNSDHIDEEFNNFMYKVTEVSEIVKKLGSTDEKLQQIGTLEADRFLNNSKSTQLENIEENNVILTVKENRSVINKKALLKDDGNRDTMSQGAFFLNFIINFY